MKLDAEGNEGSAKGARRLDLATWQLAWDRYTVAAVALDQLSFAQCQVHKDVVMEVAAGEAKNGGSAAIGVYYDAEVRAFWADQIAKRGTKFNLEEHVQCQNDVILRRAKATLGESRAVCVGSTIALPVHASCDAGAERWRQAGSGWWRPWWPGFRQGKRR